MITRWRIKGTLLLFALTVLYYTTTTTTFFFSYLADECRCLVAAVAAVNGEPNDDVMIGD